jgi:hypothetical protein
MPLIAQALEINDARTRDRFMRRFVIAPSGCWEWRMKVKNRPAMRVNGRLEVAARVAFALFKGPIPLGESHVCHTCDNSQCVNPDHLWLGSCLDNMADRSAKGRAAPVAGPLNPRAKLTAEQAREIARRRGLGQSRAAIAADFGVTEGTVWFIDKGKHWAVREAAA